MLSFALGVYQYIQSSTENHLLEKYLIEVCCLEYHLGDLIISYCQIIGFALYVLKKQKRKTDFATP